MDGVLFPEPLERLDGESGLPLPDDDDPELSAALADWQAALAELRELQWRDSADPWVDLLGEV